MTIETKFVAAPTTDDLTAKVNKAEADGWKFISLKTAASPFTDPSNAAGNVFFTMIATMQREKPGAKVEAPAPPPLNIQNSDDRGVGM